MFGKKDKTEKFKQFTDELKELLNKYDKEVSVLIFAGEAHEESRPADTTLVVARGRNKQLAFLVVKAMTQSDEVVTIIEAAKFAIDISKEEVSRRKNTKVN
jgi:hypothetical protein